MKSVKLITWNEEEQRYEMNLGSLCVSRPEELGGGKFHIFISRDTDEEDLVMNISDDRLGDGNIITINSDTNEDEANVTINAVSHFGDTVNIRHALDFLEMHNNGYYYSKARLYAGNVPNLALFEIGTEDNSPTYTLKAVNGSLDEGGLLYIPCKTRMTQNVTFTNGMQIACDVTVNDTVNFNQVPAADMAFLTSATTYSLSVRKLSSETGHTLDLRTLSAIPSGSSTVQVPIGGLILVVPNHNAFSSLATKTFIAGQEIQITDSSSALFVSATYVHGSFSSNDVKSFYVEGNRISAGTYRALSNLTFDGINSLSGNDHLWNPILLQRIA